MPLRGFLNSFLTLLLLVLLGSYGFYKLVSWCLMHVWDYPGLIDLINYVVSGTVMYFAWD